MKNWLIFNNYFNKYIKCIIFISYLANIILSIIVKFKDEMYLIQTK